MKRPIVLIGGVGVLVALLFGTLSVYFYGPSTAAPLLVFVAAILGAFLGWIANIFGTSKPPTAEPDTGQTPSTEPDSGQTQSTELKGPAAKLSRRCLFCCVFVLVVGIALGITVATIRSSVKSPKPWANIEAPKEVGEYDRVRLIWREIPKGDEVWILVFDPSTGCDKSEHCYFPQAHFEQGLSRGDEIVDVFIGREDQRGKMFELIPVLVEPEAQKALRDGAFAGMPDVPPGVIMFALSQVRRREN